MKRKWIETGLLGTTGIVLLLNIAFADPSPLSQTGSVPTFNITFVHSSASWGEAGFNQAKIQIAEDGLDFVPSSGAPPYEISFPSVITVAANVFVSSLPAGITDASSFNIWHDEMCTHPFHRVALPDDSELFRAEMGTWEDSAGYFTQGDECTNYTITLAGVEPDYTDVMGYSNEPTNPDWNGYNHSQFIHELAHTVFMQHNPAFENIISSGACINPLDGSLGDPFGIVKAGDALDNCQGFMFQTFTLGLQGIPAPWTYPGGPTPAPNATPLNCTWPTPFCATPTPN